MGLFCFVPRLLKHEQKGKMRRLLWSGPKFGCNGDGVMLGDRSALHQHSSLQTHNTKDGPVKTKPSLQTAVLPHLSAIFH
jgi:hypothetical protein